jgi:pimeloyl-ACP methyl ester carboxylesterase
VRQEGTTPIEVKLPGDRADEAGRILTYETAGDPDGAPIFLHHGMPGSSSGPRPRNAVLARLGVRLISYNRPGYGRSSRSKGRAVADAAHDVRFLAETLELDSFAVMGRSGGGPHALACAALYPELVTRAAVLVSFAPADAAGLDWYDEMGTSNTDAYHAAAFDSLRLVEQLRLRADRVRSNPAHLLDLLRDELTSADARIVGDAAIRRLLLQTYRDALTDGPYGWIDDVLALRGDWGFDPAIIRVPVRLWHGADDRFAPAGHTRWLAERIPGSIVEVQRGAAHFHALQVVPQLLQWLVSPVEVPART